MEETGTLDPIVLSLIERQREEGLTGDAFAKQLGLTPAAWSLVSRGERKPGRKLLIGAARVYPDVANICAQMLTISNSDVA